MNDVTRILSAIEQGDPHAAEQLLPLVYDELRKLAAQKLAQEKPGQTLQATALVHEAYLRLVGRRQAQHWNSRGHFFAAAAEAMRRILVEKARRKQAAQATAGEPHRVELIEVAAIAEPTVRRPPGSRRGPRPAGRHRSGRGQLVKLRYFAGLTMAQAAESLGIPLRTADRNWTYARTWLHRQVTRGQQADNR